MVQAPDKSEPSHWLAPPSWWRRAKPIRWIVALAAVAWIAHSFQLTRFLRLPERSVPGFLRPEPHPEAAQYTRVAVGVPMLDRFHSYENLQTVTTTLTGAGFERWKTTSRRAAESSSYPPYGFETVVVEGYRHLGDEGRLTLQFFNNRLFEAAFVPADPEHYSRRLRPLGLQRDANARAEKVDGHLRLASTVDLAISAVGQHLHTEPFVLWQDLRLVRERDQWDEKFGSIPKAFVEG